MRGAALKLGAAHAVGVDNDPQALIATRDNAERNDVAERLDVYLPNDESVATYPIVVANILASALIALADTLIARVAPGGQLAMSGILAGQEDEVIARYAGDFENLRAERLEDWMRVTGTRRRG
jgi:ribosomal protein L11 methyltransferase